MKKKTKLTMGAAAAAVLAIALAFLFATQAGMLLKIVLILLGAAVLAFVLWKAFVKGGAQDLKREKQHSSELQDKLDSMSHSLAALERQLSEYRNSKFNIAEINPVLHVAVVNINSSFTRTYVRESQDGTISFNGALRADICADYGVRLEDARFRFDPIANTLQVANFKPGFMGFSKKQLSWDIARSYHTHSLLGKGIVTVSDKAAEDFTAKMCAELRAELEKELDERQIKEYEWMAPLVTKQVSEVLRLMVGTPGMLISIQESGEADQSFVDFATLTRQLPAQPLPNE